MRDKSDDGSGGGGFLLLLLIATITFSVSFANDKFRTRLTEIEGRLEAACAAWPEFPGLCDVPAEPAP